MGLNKRIEIDILDCKRGRTRLKMNPNDSLIIGRASDCDQAVAGDRSLSRHHFLIEVNHSNIRLRDLGSMNGTFLNGTKISPGKIGGKAGHDWTILNDGDKVEAGRTAFVIYVKRSTRCRDCGMRIPAAQRRKAECEDGTFLCSDCRAIHNLRMKRDAERKPSPKRSEPQRKKESIAALNGHVEVQPKMNPEQRKRAEKNPADVVEELLRKVFHIDSDKKESSPAIGGYSNIRLIGKGAFGAVYKATRESDGQPVALKTMLQTQNSNACNEGLFKREQEIISQLKHPNIVPAFRCSCWEDLHFIEMEYVPYGNLWDCMKRSGDGKLPLEQSAEIMLQVAAGLAYAHGVQLTVTTRKGKKAATGVVHRDIKPPNILLSKSENKITPKISDYGLAKAFELSGLTLGSLSHADMWRGTYFYMAREHITKYMYVEPVTDVFETAATFFHMLTGQGVWPSKRAVPNAADILNSEPKRLKNIAPSLPKKLHTVFDNALTAYPDNRIQNGQEFMKELEKAL